MPRKNPESFERYIKEFVLTHAQLQGEDVCEIRVDLVRPEVATRTRFKIYAYLTALEGFDKFGPEHLQRNRTVATLFKRNFGLRVEGKELVLIPKSFEAQEMEHLRSLTAEARGKTFGYQNNSLPVLDVGVGQITMNKLVKEQEAQAKQVEVLRDGEVQPKSVIDVLLEKLTVADKAADPIQTEAAPSATELERDEAKREFKAKEKAKFEWYLAVKKAKEKGVKVLPERPAELGPLTSAQVATLQAQGFELRLDKGAEGPIMNESGQEADQRSETAAPSSNEVTSNE